MDKDKLRARKRLTRLFMAPADVEAASRQIIENLVAETDWKATKSLHTFVPIPKLNEINTWPLLKHAWQNYPQLTTAIATTKEAKRQSFRVNQATRWRGLLPSSQVPMPEDFKFDVIIVPSLAFDERLYRLGWGGGWYDRFLAGQPKALKIGLCFANGRVEHIPDEPHDIRLDKIITEKDILG